MNQHEERKFSEVGGCIDEGFKNRCQLESAKNEYPVLNCREIKSLTFR